MSPEACKNFDPEFVAVPRAYDVSEPLGSLRSGVAPVSYTHLDVYKRQVLKIALEHWLLNFYPLSLRRDCLESLL